MSKVNNYDFDLIISSEDLKRNREKSLNLNKISSKNKRKKSIKKISMGLLVAIVVFVFIALINAINNDMEKHIEKVSSECAMQGYGITAKYTKEGDKYYVCKK